jgi:hypothetical protein
VYNLTGQEVYGKEMELDGLKQIRLITPAGWYVVKLVIVGGVISEKIFIK